MNIRIPENDPALSWQFARSSGPGGQNVNKTESKAVLYFDIVKSNSINEEDKRCLLCVTCSIDENPSLNALQNRMTAGGKIMIANQESRSRETNKYQALETLNKLLSEALTKAEPRRLGMVPKAKSKHYSNINKEKLLKYKDERLG